MNYIHNILSSSCFSQFFYCIVSNNCMLLSEPGWYPQVRVPTLPDTFYLYGLRCSLLLVRSSIMSGGCLLGLVVYEVTSTIYMYYLFLF